MWFEKIFFSMALKCLSLLIEGACPLKRYHSVAIRRRKSLQVNYSAPNEQHCFVVDSLMLVNQQNSPNHFAACILRWLYLRCKARHLNLPPNDLSFTWRSFKMSPFVLVCHCSVNWCLFNTLVLSDAFLPWIHLIAQFGRIATAWINDSKIRENYRSHILH